MIIKIKDKSILIDIEDFNNLPCQKIRIKKDGRVDFKFNGKFVLLHRFIMNATAGVQVDHIDGNPLNNLRENLRICNNSQNQQNSKKRAHCRTNYKGVTFRRECFELNINGKFIRTFDSEKDAAIGYDILSKELYGEFSRPNFTATTQEDLKRVSDLLKFKKGGKSFFTSKHKGIGYHINSKKWRARVKIEGKWKTLGYHKTEEEALNQLMNHYENSSK